MKTKKILFPAIIAMIMTSCASKSYYQVYKAMPVNNLVIIDNLLVYEDKNCKVSYNLWGEGGNIGFQFFNKSDRNIYLNLGESFFILNGVSYNYYRSRVFTSSTSSGATTSRGATVTKSISGLNSLDLTQTNRISASNTVGKITPSDFPVLYNEEKIVCIPSKTSKFISEYKVNESLFRDCDLFKYPTKKQIKSSTFSKEQSPIVFGNRVAYSIGQTDSLIRFENEFYVAEISNYPERQMFETKYDENCGQKIMTKTRYFKNVSSDKFYIKYKYSIGQDTWKH
jgi:hypothetical protein